MRAIRGEGMAQADPAQFGRTGKLRIEPQSPGLDKRIWWGAGTRETAEWVGSQGINLMSSTLLTEATGEQFADLQTEQLERFRGAWKAAGHEGAPRVSVSRSIFPIVSEEDRLMFGMNDSHDQIGMIDGFRSTFGKTYAAEPDLLIEQLKADAAVMSADTVMLTIPSQLGPDFNLHILEAFATHVAPALGWEPNTAGPVRGYDIS
uniref:alkane 1-monooxygenase n=1 Tax=Tessaracoccus timonensis TaxID=2161816 RepID=UPI0018D52FCB|nr:alkane 1-monooxygenase [Tessaracoccus timonensis]